MSLVLMDEGATGLRRGAPVVMIVEDDSDIAVLVGLALRRAGYGTVTVADGRDVIDAVRTTTPEIVLLDLGLPGVDGLTVLDTLRADPSTSEVPILIMTARDSAASVVEGLSRGAFDYLRKPFDLAELVARVGSGLRHHGSRSGLRLRTRQLEIQSQIDPVTGGANRAHLETAIAREWERAQLRDAPVSVMMLDLDGFKELNDELGHQAGDRVLAELSGLFRSVLRLEDVFGRWGGDEFLAMLPDTAEDGAANVGMRLGSRCREWSATSDARITLSCGIAASTPQPGDEVGALLAAADEALYLAKAAGRDTFRVASVVK